MGAKANVQFSEADLDGLISSVEGALKLAKNFPPKEDEEGADPSAQAAPADADPAAAAPAAAPAGAPAENAAAPAEGAAPAAAADAGAPGAPAEGAPGGDPSQGAPGEGQLAQEGQPGAEDAPLSDEELNEIYQSMPPEELERHYMIIRQHLQQAYAKAELDSKGANGGNIEAEGARGATQTTHDGPTGGNESAMGKSEDFAALQAKVANQDKALETIIKAFETFTKPSRKAVTGTVDFIRKSEFDQSAPGAGGTVDVSQLSKAEKVKILNDIGPAPLSKAERDQANAYILRGEYQTEVDKIISRGKK